MRASKLVGRPGRYRMRLSRLSPGRPGKLHADKAYGYADAAAATSPVRLAPFGAGAGSPPTQPLDPAWAAVT